MGSEGSSEPPSTAPFEHGGAAAGGDKGSKGKRRSGKRAKEKAAARAAGGGVQDVGAMATGSAAASATAAGSETSVRGSSFDAAAPPVRPTGVAPAGSGAESALDGGLVPGPAASAASRSAVSDSVPPAPAPGVGFGAVGGGVGVGGSWGQPLGGGGSPKDVSIRRLSHTGYSPFGAELRPAASTVASFAMAAPTAAPVAAASLGAALPAAASASAPAPGGDRAVRDAMALLGLHGFSDGNISPSPRSPVQPPAHPRAPDAGSARRAHGGGGSVPALIPHPVLSGSTAGSSAGPLAALAGPSGSGLGAGVGGQASGSGSGAPVLKMAPPSDAVVTMTPSDVEDTFMCPISHVSASRTVQFVI